MSDNKKRSPCRQPLLARPQRGRPRNGHSGFAAVGLILVLLVFVTTMATVSIGRSRAVNRQFEQRQIRRTLKSAIDSVQAARIDLSGVPDTDPLTIRLPVGNDENTHILIQFDKDIGSDDESVYGVATYVRRGQDQTSIRRIINMNQERTPAREQTK